MIETIDVTDYADYDAHEKVLCCRDEETGLTAWIALHNTNRGPALGGCRIRQYPDDEAAITDVLRLSRGMTYKSAMADLPLGGGKAVINCDPANKTDAMLESMGDFVDSLNGDYIIAEDSGTSVADMAVMSRRTRHVAGLASKLQIDGRTADGDPSPSTAYGVLKGIEAAVRYRLNVTSLQGIRVAVQGVGNVGSHVVDLLADAGAELIIADVSPTNIKAVTARHDVMVVEPDEIMRIPADVFAPCALGGILSFDSLNEMSAQIIAGAANNQLASDSAGYEMFARGKLYAPDYVINPGGIIDLYYEQEGYDHQTVLAHIDRIGDTLTQIFERSREEHLPTHVIADQIAVERFSTDAKTDVA